MPTFTSIALQNLLQHRTSGNNILTNQEQVEKKSNARKPVNWRIDGFEVESDGIGGDCVQIEEDAVADDDDDDDDENDDFVDPGCDSSSVASSTDLNDSSRLGFENMSVASNQIGEFYDATEDFSSDGPLSSVSSCRGNIELELHGTRINLLVEIEKRKAAEDDVAAMRTYLHKVSKFLLMHSSLAPAPSSNDSSSTTRFDVNAFKQLSEEAVVVRFVAEAMEKAEAKEEAELAAQLIMATKDKEISRLQDRLRYCEAVIHEMSQNNLESIEVARRRRERRRVQRKWLWRCIGMSVVIGASVIGYSYAPHRDPLENVGDAHAEAAYD